MQMYIQYTFTSVLRTTSTSTIEHKKDHDIGRWKSISWHGTGTYRWRAKLGVLWSELTFVKYFHVGYFQRVKPKTKVQIHLLCYK
jgi:hypothetical protein